MVLDGNALVHDVPGPPQSVLAKQQPQPEPEGRPRILCGAVSSSGSHLALCDDHKQMTIWRCRDWAMTKQCHLQRRANGCTFLDKQGLVLVADKTGDVFSYEVEGEGEGGRLLLGHLSMLLGLAMSPCGRFLVTCDRDEKIRVSKYPNAYNIHNYCLGHTEFVTGVSILPSQPHLLVSSSGDGTIRLWDYLSGEELGRRTCHEDAGMAGDKYSGEDKEGEAANVPAVRCLRVAPGAAGEGDFLAVVVNGFKGLLIYYSARGTNELSLRQKVQLDEEAWDVNFSGPDTLLAVERSPADGGRIKAFERGPGREEFKPRELDAAGSQINELLQDSKDFPLGLEELYKRWFDNMKEYLDRKMERISNSKKIKTTGPAQVLSAN